MKKITNKKAQTGVVTATIFGMIGLVILLIIGFVFIDTLTSANLFSSVRPTLTTTNESQFSSGQGIVFVNQTGYTLADFSANNFEYTIVSVVADWNQSNGSAVSIAAVPTGYNVTVNSANYSLSAAGLVRNATNYVFPNVSITYTYKTKSNSERAVNNVSANLSQGVQDDLAPKVKTGVLIAAVIFLVTLLVLLWRFFQGTGLMSRSNI